MSRYRKNLDTKGILFTLKFFGVIGIFFALVQAVFFFYGEYKISDIISDEVDAKISDLKNKNKANVINFNSNKEIKLGFVGDIMLDRNVERAILTKGEGDFDFPFEYIGVTLREYDFMFGNLEGSVSNKGEDRGSIYSFRMDTKAIAALKKAGFDILSVANNHSADWGGEAMYDTMRRLEGAGIRYVGGGFNKPNAYRPKIIDINGTKIAYTAFSQFESGRLENSAVLAHLNKENLRRVLKSIRNEVNIIIVSMHFGDEYKSLPNKFQESIAKFAIDEGADLVVGHHPHVVQPVEKYKNGYIAYSLGNFIFDQNFSEETMQGLLLDVLIKSGK